MTTEKAETQTGIVMLTFDTKTYRYSNAQAVLIGTNIMTAILYYMYMYAKHQVPGVTKTFDLRFSFHEFG